MNAVRLSLAACVLAAFAAASGLPEEYRPKPRVEKPKEPTPRVEKAPGEKGAPTLHDVSITFAVGGVADDQLPSAVSKMAVVLERRAFGLAQKYEVMPDGQNIGRITVDLKGCAEPDRALEILMTPGRLAFEAVAERPAFLAVIGDAWPQDKYIPYEHDNLLVVAAADQPAFVVAATPKIAPGQRLFWTRAFAAPGGDFRRVALATGDAMTVAGVIDAAAVKDSAGNIRVDFKLEDADAVAFSGLTGRHVGDALAVVFDDEVLYTARVKERADYYVTIFGEGLDKERAQDIALLLNSGSLPAVLAPLAYAVDGQNRPLPPGR